MSLHADLLAQARLLARKETRRPQQASLRRAVSAAYYALFHLLSGEASELYSRRLFGICDREFSAGLRRLFIHKEMASVSKRVAKGSFPARLGSHTTPATAKSLDDIKIVAATFVSLQQARHTADYDMTRGLTRQETIDLLQQATDAVEAWQRVRRDPIARIYLAWMLLPDRLDRDN